MAAAEMKAADGRESALFDRLIEQHPGEFFIIVELPNVVAGSAPQRIDPLAQKRIPGNRLFRVRQGFSEVAAFRSSDIRQMTVGADTGDRHVRAVLFVRLEERDGHSLLPRDLLRSADPAWRRVLRAPKVDPECSGSLHRLARAAGSGRLDLDGEDL